MSCARATSTTPSSTKDSTHSPDGNAVAGTRPDPTVLQPSSSRRSLPVTGLGTGRHDGPVCGLPAEAAAPVHESARAGPAVASGLGHAGARLADAVRHAFAVAACTTPCSPPPRSPCWAPSSSPGGRPAEPRDHRQARGRRRSRTRPRSSRLSRAERRFTEPTRDKEHLTCRTSPSPPGRSRSASARADAAVTQAIHQTIGSPLDTVRVWITEVSPKMSIGGVPLDEVRARRAAAGSTNAVPS
jgi:phenylpyruvate tautomerase PptA (4-oxalocrotonate tautomerase family)